MKRSPGRHSPEFAISTILILSFDGVVVAFVCATIAAYCGCGMCFGCIWAQTSLAHRARTGIAAWTATKADVFAVNQSQIKSDRGTQLLL